MLLCQKINNPVEVVGIIRPAAEGTLENLINLSAEGARLKAESLRQKDGADKKLHCCAMLV